MSCAAKSKPVCVECGRVTRRKHGILDIFLCSHCHDGHPDNYGLVTKTRALREYRLKESDLEPLPLMLRPNPYHKTGKSMYLYLHRQIRNIAKTKYGVAERYIVQFVPLVEKHLEWLRDDPERIHSMSPRAFQRFIADRLDAMGMEVQICGDIYRKDGGIDIVAYPKANAVAIPFLLGVQVKHHSTSANTGPADVRDLAGVIAAQGFRFNAGMLVTNTAFTPDATWFAQNHAAMLRLRDMNDLRRWLLEDFQNEAEWREIPQTLVLAPGVEIIIPRPKLIVPDDPVRSSTRQFDGGNARRLPLG